MDTYTKELASAHSGAGGATPRGLQVDVQHDEQVVRGDVEQLAREVIEEKLAGDYGARPDTARASAEVEACRGRPRAAGVRASEATGCASPRVKATEVGV